MSDKTFKYVVIGILLGIGFLIYSKDNTVVVSNPVELEYCQHGIINC